MIKNPKKNYSLKGKPLSTKIAFVVICILVFSLILGSFGGLIYLGKSCFSTFTTVSAEGVGSEEEVVFKSAVSLNVNGIDYFGDELRTADNQVCNFNYFMFYLPLTFRTESFNGVQDLWIESSYFDEDFNSILTEKVYLRENLPDTVFNYGCYCYDDDFLGNVGLVINFVENYVSPNSVGRFAEVSSVDFSFHPAVGGDAVLTLQLNDTHGSYVIFEIHPYNRGESLYLNQIYNFSAFYTYKLVPFNRTALEKEYDRGFRDGVLYNRREHQAELDEAFGNGVDAGKEQGFLEGVASATNYSFSGLLDAVFYAPVKMFVSLFNFDFLGVNVLGFVTTIITIIIAFGIIKFFL